jgi:hypothetical protein
MRDEQFINEEDWNNYISVLSLKLKNGFIIEEKNDTLPFTVLSKKNKKLNYDRNMLLCCITFGFWFFAWFYFLLISRKKKKILIAIDEDGKTFVESCY